MAKRSKVIVKSNILFELNNEIRKIKKRSTKGVMKALLVIKREALIMTPTKEGNLRKSCYTETFRTLQGPVGEIGYTAYYAPWVHEIDKNYRKTGTSWKFLEKALKRNKKKVLKIIRDEAYIK